MVVRRLVPNVFSNLLVDFACSLSSFVVACFAENTGFRGLSVRVCSVAREEVSPGVGTLSTLLFLTMLVIVIVVGLHSERRRGIRGGEA